MNSNFELEFKMLKQQFTVMQREINDVLKVVNGDLYKIMDAVKEALNAFDARLEAAEKNIAELKNPPVRSETEGKEL